MKPHKHDMRMKRFLQFALLLISAIVLLASCEKAPFITMTGPRTFNFTRDGGTQSVSFTCNRPWSVSSTESWIQISPSSGEASDKEITITIKCMPNTTYDPRSATVTVKLEELSETLTVTQDTGLGLIVSPTTFTLTNAEQTIEIEVQQNINYAVEIDELCKDWIRLSSKVDTKALTTDKVIFAILANNNYDAREGKITFRQTDGSLVESVIIKQSYNEGLIVENTKYEIDYKAQSLEIEVKSNVEYEVSSMVDWINHVETKALSSKTIILAVSENTSYDDRVGHIIIKKIGGDLSETIDVTQKGTTNIIFQDATVKSICIQHFDQNKDGELSFEEASLVTSLIRASVNIPDYEESVIYGKNITSFNELRFFTSLKTIPELAFCDTGIEEVSLPDSVEEIGPGAFLNAKISKIDFPNKLKYIGYNAFASCMDLHEIVIPESVEELFDAFRDSGVSSIKALGSIIGGCSGCKNLTEVTIPNNVKKISGMAFYGCPITKITIPSSVTEVQTYAFWNCRNLTEIIIENDVIGDAMFSSTGITNLIIPEHVHTIGAGAFSNCKDLASINLPKALASLGRGVFTECEKLESIVVPSAITEIPSRLFDRCTNLKNVELMGDVISIGDNAFYNCTNLNDFEIPAHVRILEANAFSNVHFDTIVLPESIESIGKECFMGCSPQYYIIRAQDPPSLGINAFGDHNYPPIYVLPESVAKYKSAWSYLSSVIKSLDEL